MSIIIYVEEEVRSSALLDRLDLALELKHLNRLMTYLIQSLTMFFFKVCKAFMKQI